MKCRKKPIEYEFTIFIGFDKGKPVFSEEPEWLANALGKEISIVSVGEFSKLKLCTPRWRKLITQGDYILYDGELNACHSYEFEKEYERI